MQIYGQAKLILTCPAKIFLIMTAIQSIYQSLQKIGCNYPQIHNCLTFPYFFPIILHFPYPFYGSNTHFYLLPCII